MSIVYDEAREIFALHTPDTTYMIGLMDHRYVGHVYYGARLETTQGAYLMRRGERSRVPSERKRDAAGFFNEAPFEYPVYGKGDFREACLAVTTKGGFRTAELICTGYKIFAGKPALTGLPATFGTEEECDTLELYLEDRLIGLSVVLVYTAFRDLDVITRSARITNESWDPIYLDKVLSACLDMDNEGFDLVTLSGAWGRERGIVRRPVVPGKQGVGSVQGKSSNTAQPFLMICDHNADDAHGRVWGMHFVYSGDFLAQAEEGQQKNLRAVMGIHPENFRWKLAHGKTFTAPEVVMIYSGEGIGKMSRTFHDLYRGHLIRSPWLMKDKPILINNWEATYFNFNTQKLLEIAAEAKKLGIEMLVMDDGWFGRRNNDCSSLGDWWVNEEKLPGGVTYLAEQLKAMGMKMGIWFEPEMVSPDSDLYRAHPDWAIQVPGREPVQARQQLVLDITRNEVFDYVYESVAKILRSADIAYVKWDMNRSLTDLGSAVMDAEYQGELVHRYVKAVYRLQEQLITEFPDLLLENCSSGGDRFDPGMLYYSPQIWCSDNMDVADRMAIQEGTALCFPLSTMGAHVGASPNHTTGRCAPMQTRGYAAMAGTFGYELDVTRIPEEDRALIPGQCEDYHRYHHLVETGDYYRIASWQENHEYDCYEVAAKDKSEALVTFIQILSRPNYSSYRIRLQGLDPHADYALTGTDEVYHGDLLMQGGYLVQREFGDLKGKLLHFTRRQ